MDLSADEQVGAEEKAAENIIRAILEGRIRFNDEANRDDLQARIDAQIQKAEDMQTPWFAPAYLYDDPVVKEAIEGMARSQAEDAVYLDAGEQAIRLAATTAGKDGNA